MAVERTNGFESVLDWSPSQLVAKRVVKKMKASFLRDHCFGGVRRLIVCFAILMTNKYQTIGIKMSYERMDGLPSHQSKPQDKTLPNRFQ